MSRRRSNTITVDVDIDLDDELDDETLIKMMKQRGLSVDIPASLAGAPSCTRLTLWDDFADEVRAAARNGDLPHLEVLLIRIADFAAVPRHTVARSALDIATDKRAAP